MQELFFLFEKKDLTKRRIRAVSQYQTKKSQRKRRRLKEEEKERRKKYRKKNKKKGKGEMLIT